MSRPPVLIPLGGMTTIVLASRERAIGNRLSLFLGPKYLRIIRGRLAMPIWGMKLYSVVATPFLLILRVRDSFAALMAAFVPMFIALLLDMIYMYRPGLFEAAPYLPRIMK